MSRFRLLLGPRTPPVVFGGAPVYDLTPKALPGAFRMGVNFSGPESNNAYPDEGMIRDAAAHGFDWFRQPLSWDNLQPTLDGAISSSEYAKLSAVMALALKYGLKVLPDIHTYGAHLGKKVGASGGDTPTTYGRFWQQLSTRFMADVSYAAIAGYDLMNEWQGMDTTQPPVLQPDGTYAPWDSSNAASQAIVEASVNAARDQIRANSDATTLYIELDHYTSAWEWALNTPSQQNLAIFLRLFARDTNIVASVHMYADNDNSGRNGDWNAETLKQGLAPAGLATNVNIGIQRLSMVVAAAYQYGFRLHLGECGWGGNNTTFGDVTGWLQFGEATLAYLKACNIQFCFFSGGWNFPAGPNGYYYCVTPYDPITNAFSYSPTAIRPSNGKQLQKYGGAPKAVSLWLPYDGAGNITRRCIVGQPSAPFEILYGGNIPTDITITPVATLMDGTPAGGTFTAVKLPAGQHIDDSATFTYTASQAATFNISVTNDKGLANSPALGFSSASDSFTGAAVVPSNIYALRRIYSPYTGPAIRLRPPWDTSGNSDMDFYFNNRGDLPRQAIQTWASSRTIQIVTLYDQSPNGLHATVAGTAPTLTLVNAQGYPEITWPDGCKMQFNTSATQQGALTLLVRAKPSNNNTILSNDNFVDNFRLSNGSFYTAPNGGHSTVSFTGISIGSWGYIGGTWSNIYGTNNLKAYLNGSVANQVNTSGAFTSPVGTYTTLGDNRFGGNRFVGALDEIILAFEEYSAARIALFNSDASTYYSTALPDTLSAVAPTISGTAPTSVVQGSYDQPFAGVTIADTNSGTPTDSVSIALTGGAGTLAGTGLSGSGPYTIAAASAASITSTLRALTWTPSGAAGSTTTFAITVTSSAGTAATDSSTVVTVRAYQPETALTPQATAGTLPRHYKGVNLSGGENDYTYTGETPGQHLEQWPSTSLFDHFNGIGLKTIRLPFRWDDLQPVLYQPIDQGVLANVTPLVERARANGQYILLDAHMYGSWHMDDPSTDVGTTAVPISAFADFWKRMATIFQHYPNVIYGLMNEPHRQSAALWQQCAAGAHQAILTVTTTQMVFLQGTSYTGAHSWVGSGNAAAWAGYTASGPFCFEMHEYLDSDYSGSHPQCVNGYSQMAGATNWLRTNGFKGFIGEFAWSTDSSCASIGPQFVQGMTTDADVWLGWTFWSGGPEFGSGYMFNINPNSDGSDQPQVATLIANLANTF